jgi:hypothetical protein
MIVVNLSQVLGWGFCPLESYLEIKLNNRLAVVNGAAMNMGVQVSLLCVDLYPFGYMPRVVEKSVAF